MDQTARHLQVLTETIAAVNSTLDLEEVLGLVASKVAEALAADACFVYLYDERSDELVLRAAHGASVELELRPRMRPGEGLTGTAVAEQAPRYGNIKVPVVVIAGDTDTTVSPNIHSRRLAATVPNAKLIVLPGVGHMVQYAAPDVVVREIEAMIADLTAAPKAAMR